MVFEILTAVLALALLLGVILLEKERKKNRELVSIQQETVHLLHESYDRERALMDRNEELVKLGANYGSIATLLYDYIWGHTADTEKELKNSRRGWMLREMMEKKEWKDILNNHEWLTATEWGEVYDG